MSLGKRLDLLAGAASRLVHLRAARENTVGDLGRYLDLSAADLFPPPEPIRDLRIAKRTRYDRWLRSSTLRWTSTHRVFSPAYRARHHGEFASNLTGWARWVRPDGTPRRRCLIYVHGWMEPGSWLEEWTLFKTWTRHLAADMVHVTLPFHGSRKPAGSRFSGEYFWTADLVRTVEGVRQSLSDIRAIMAWLRQQGYREVGISGVSLGGALTMLLGCVEPSPDFIIPIVSHLELEDAVEEAPILWRMKRDLEKWGIDRFERRRIFERLGISRFAPRLEPERQLWIQARDDLYINASLAEAQWESWGRPPIHWIRGGHMTFPLHVAEFTARMKDFLDRGRPAARSAASH